MKVGRPVRIFQDKGEMYVSQLVPLPQHLSRIKLKLFGASGVGKTTLLIKVHQEVLFFLYIYLLI
jgi:GTPase SAR1 family protein